MGEFVSMYVRMYIYMYVCMHACMCDVCVSGAQYLCVMYM